MGDPFGLVSDLQSSLQKSVSKRGGSYTSASVSWSWVCIKLVNLLSNYPSGVTRAIAMSELDNEFQKSGGKLVPFHTQQQKCSTVSSVLDSKSILFESILEVHMTAFHDMSGTTTKIAHLVDNEDDDRHLQMYLHRKFYDILQLLRTHTVRISCCRLVSSGASSKSRAAIQLCLLPTEHMAILVDDVEANEMEHSFSTQVQSASITQPAYIDNIQAKVADVSETELLYSPDGTSYNRLVVQLSDSEGDTVPLVLWDSYVGFARLFTKGDTLLLERPYARPANSVNGGSSYCLEFGPATLLYVLPYVPEQEILLSQHPTQLTITVKKTDDGHLDFLSYPERLCVDDLLPNMINGVMLSQCLKVGERQTDNKEEQLLFDRFHIEVQDSSGRVSVAVMDPTFTVHENIHHLQWLLMTGLSSHREQGGCGISLTCDLKKGGQIINVSSLPGLLMSSDLYSSVTLREAQNLPPLTQFIVSATLESWVLHLDNPSGQQLLRPVHCTCRNRVDMQTDGAYCQACDSRSLSMLSGNGVDGKTVDGLWRWEYDLRARLKDESRSGVIVQFTTNSAEALLQRSPLEVSLLPPEEELQKLLVQFNNKELRACVSKTDVDDYQVNWATLVVT